MKMLQEGIELAGLTASALAEVCMKSEVKGKNCFARPGTDQGFDAGHHW